jgi:hypothetical protein
MREAASETGWVGHGGLHEVELVAVRDKLNRGLYSVRLRTVCNAAWVG